MREASSAEKLKTEVAQITRSTLSRPRSLGIAEWPMADQAAWNEALRPSVRLQRGGAAAHLAKVSQKDIANRYGLYLDFLQRNGLFDPTSGAANLVSPGHVQKFITELKDRVSSVTLWNSIYKLRRAAECLTPNVDFGWLSEIEKDLALVAEPRDKTDRLVLADRLLEAGLALIQDESFATTPMRRARGVRNGLIIALLALHPLRIKNYGTLKVGASIKKIEGHWWLLIHTRQTKSHRLDERRVPEFMTEIIDRYLGQYRPLLLGNATQVSAFWISSTRHTQFTTKNMGTLISKITKETVGVDVSPHLFRMSATTTAAVYGSAMPYLATALMGHRDKRINEEHYNRARSLHASAVLADIIETCKSAG